MPFHIEIRGVLVGGFVFKSRRTHLFTFVCYKNGSASVAWVYSGCRASSANKPGEFCKEGAVRERPSPPALPPTALRSCLPKGSLCLRGFISEASFSCPREQSVNSDTLTEHLLCPRRWVTLRERDLDALLPSWCLISISLPESMGSVWPHGFGVFLSNNLAELLSAWKGQGRHPWLLTQLQAGRVAWGRGRLSGL